MSEDPAWLMWSTSPHQPPRWEILAPPAIHWNYSHSSLHHGISCAFFSFPYLPIDPRHCRTLLSNDGPSYRTLLPLAQESSARLPRLAQPPALLSIPQAPATIWSFGLPCYLEHPPAPEPRPRRLSLCGRFARPAGPYRGPARRNLRGWELASRSVGLS